MLDTKKVSRVHVRHLRRIDDRINKGDGWADIRAERIVLGTEFNFISDSDNETIRVRVVSIHRRPPNWEHAHVEVAPEIVAEEIVADR